MCDGTDDPNQTGTKGPTEPTGTTLAELGQPNQVRQPSRTGTAHSQGGTAQAELGQPSRLGRPSPTWDIRKIGCPSPDRDGPARWDVPRKPGPAQFFPRC